MDKYEQKTLTNVKHVLFCKEKKQIKKIYEDAFPKKERMPFVLMVAMSLLLTTKFFAFYDNERLCGLIYMAKIGRQAFIMFFAVDEQLRSKGYGAKILGILKNKYPNCKIVVSIEPCNESAQNFTLCQRRKNFYLQNGFCDTGYNIKLNGINQEILISGGAFRRVTFSVFLIFYSCFAIIPNIRKRVSASEKK